MQTRTPLETLRSLKPFAGLLLVPDAVRALMAAQEFSWHAMSIEDVVRERGTNLDRGLSSEQVKRLREQFGELRDRLRPGGMLWVSWPKGGKLGTDLTIKSVIAIGYELNMVESTCLRIDEVWSGLKFTHPKPGKTYANSYGTLPDQRT